MNLLNDRNAQRGQVMITVVVVLTVFLLAFAGIATDYTNFWHQKQKAQSGADAVCQAAAMDLKLIALGTPTPTTNFDPANGAFLCSANPTAAPCVIAKLNGYDPAQAINHINLSFPTAAPACPTAPITGVTYPCVTVDLAQDETAYLSRIMTGSNTVTVGGHATCGLTPTNGPVPIVVLHPTAPQNVTTFTNHPNSIYMAGGPGNTITVVGGPQVSVQVNSNDPNAVTSGSLSTVDLSHGWAPNNTGSDFAVFGGTSTQPGSVLLGSTGHWRYPRTPKPDPYRFYSAPAQPPAGTKFAAIKGTTKCPTGTSADPRGCYKVNGCPDPNGCDEYTPGYYPNNIQVKNGTAMFEPGLYYLGNGLDLNSNSIARVTCCGGTADGDGSGGVMFYFKGTGTLNVDANSGKAGLVNDPVTKLPNYYYVAGGTNNGIQSRALQCPGGGANPPQIFATIDGNMLVGPCTGPYRDPSGQYRGFLFFQDRSVAASPSWQGGGATLASGFMYFHQCNAGGTGINCTMPPGANSYGTVFQLGGNPGSGSYTLGSIVTDRILVNGTPDITMILSPYNAFPDLLVGMFK